ncbi:Mut7-C RNAse domain-containing protein [Dactylosporangium cerinum]|uniref:Mut7-C RNAse domain-containing protein n=1 Tax=Dactylosporangium cerinum TaxID=1434730 RepID=A0ABV9WFJ6_9ACTN
MRRSTVRVRVAEPLRFLLPVRHRHGDVTVPVDGVSNLRHVVESLGVPRTEIGELCVNGQPARPSARPGDGDVIDVLPVSRPQRVADPRFVLDVHLGTLARRMRLLGLDVAYRNDAADAELAAQSAAEGRIVLTQDRGLLRRRALAAGAYVRGSRADEQLLDVLGRFDPPLVPWSRCPACNGILEPVAKREVEHLLAPGTRRSYSEFARCRACGRIYWRGAHADRLDAIVAAVAGRRGTYGSAEDR